MHEMKHRPDMAAEFADHEANPPANIGWAQGVLSDGRSWMAALWEDDEGDRTLSISYPANGYDDNVDEESLIQQLLDEELVVPLADGIEFFVAEKRDDLFSPDPIWMVEILLSDFENEWARPGFVVRDPSEHRIH